MQSSRAVLDAAGAPLHPAARETLLAAADAGWADPRRLYAEGRRAAALLDQARDVLADGLGVRPEDLSFLPSGPAALTAGLDGLLYAGRRRGGGLVASAVEHSAVLVMGRHRAAQAPDGSAVLTEVPVGRTGAVDLAAWADAVVAPGVAAAALQSANGEIGTRQPLAAAHEAARAAGVPLLVDAMAGLGRDPTPTSYDVLAGDARSFGGPGGVGLLVVPARTRWRRSGPPTELEGGRSDVAPVVPLALAAAEAWRQTAAVHEAEAEAARSLVDAVRRAVAGIADVQVAGDATDRLPHVVTFSVVYADGEALVSELDRRGFAIASGSACTSSTLEPSHVLAATGTVTHGNVRLVLPLAAVAADRAEDVARFLAVLPAAVAVVRSALGADPL